MLKMYEGFEAKSKKGCKYNPKKIKCTEILFLKNQS